MPLTLGHDGRVTLTAEYPFWIKFEYASYMPTVKGATRNGCDVVALTMGAIVRHAIPCLL